MSNVEEVKPWAFMKFFTLREKTTNKIYLRRLRIIQTPFFSLYLHFIGMPDPGVDLHNHPWWFASLVLRGGYDEIVGNEQWEVYYGPGTDLEYKSWRAGSIHSLKLDETHRISRLHKKHTWTLVLTGPRKRSWGFFTPDGFVDYRDYDHELARGTK